MRYAGPVTSGPDSAEDISLPTSHAAKNPLLPSRIPVPAKRKDQEFPRQDNRLPPIDRRPTNQYAHTAKPPPANGKRRESSAKYKLRLAEKDQKILETHEFIQVCI